MASGEDGDASEESGDGAVSGAPAAEGNEDAEREEEEGAGSGDEGRAAAATDGEERRRPVAPLFSFPPGPRVRRTEAEDSLQVNYDTIRVSFPSAAARVRAGIGADKGQRRGRERTYTCSDVLFIACPSRLPLPLGSFTRKVEVVVEFVTGEANRAEQLYAQQYSVGTEIKHAVKPDAFDRCWCQALQPQQLAATNTVVSSCSGSGEGERFNVDGSPLNCPCVVTKTRTTQRSIHRPATHTVNLTTESSLARLTQRHLSVFTNSLFIRRCSPCSSGW